MSGGWGYRGRETSVESQRKGDFAESQRKGDLAESQELMEAGESEEGRPQQRVMNGWRLESRRKGDLSGESEEGRPRGDSGMGGSWGVGGRETSVENQEWVMAGESEEGRPQWRVRNGWKLGSRRKGDLS
ncbi:hypothetical protein NDU88_001008 [Pleurodeles waltl]|uniref:Uncharacterized protein n=1 Tax=Pleurodeles waltl TaxID=8319 RepID=A0AAV7KRH2_PLEWA|nr:hypothetical protein NDU88_001008 [Pleurodeles waltl]